MLFHFGGFCCYQKCALDLDTSALVFKNPNMDEREDVSSSQYL